MKRKKVKQKKLKLSPPKPGKIAEYTRRKEELKDGQYLSLRPSLEHKSKKEYSRTLKHKNSQSYED